MAWFVHTLDNYWLTLQYDLEHWLQTAENFIEQLKNSWYSLIFSNVLSSLIILQLVYLLPFSQIVGLASTWTDVSFKIPAFAKSIYDVKIAPESSAPVASTIKVSDLQSVLNTWVVTHPGQYGIVIQDLTGKQGTATFNANKQFVSASLYKL